MKQKQVDPDRNPWMENVFRPLVIGVMFGCIALSLVELVRLFLPDRNLANAYINDPSLKAEMVRFFLPGWNGTLIVLACVLAALEANYSYRLIRAKSLRGSDLLRFRIIEIAVFFLLIKIGSYVGESWPGVLADIGSWPSHLYRIFDIETIAAFVLVLISWHVSTQTARDFDRLHEPPIYHRYDVPPMESLTERFFWGGAVLLIAAGLTRIGIAQIFNLRRPSVPGLVLNVLVYFLLGLVMLGQVRFATLQKRWRTGETKVAEELPRRWVRYSLSLIGLAAFLAFLLPTGYTLGLLEVIGYVLATILTVISLVATLLSWLILFPFAWLMSVLGVESAPARPVEPLPPPSLGNTGGYVGPGWFQIVRSLVLWAIALGIVFYVVRSYVRDHPELFESLAALGLVRALRRMWAVLWRWLGGWGVTLKERMPRGWSLRLGRRDRLSQEPFGFFRLGALSPRSQILYYYLSVLHRAAKQGFPRRPAETPDEYRATLGPNLPEAQGEMDQLTHAFVEARYSRCAIKREDARRVRSSWQQVKTALRTLKGKTEEEA
jgi:hypothetical protein